MKKTTENPNRLQLKVEAVRELSVEEAGDAAGGTNLAALAIVAPRPRPLSGTTALGGGYYVPVVNYTP